MKFTSPVYATASGSIAGVTYGRNRNGLYTRARTRPVNPRSIRQSTVRSIFNTLVVVWNDELSGSQRLAWETWSSNTPSIDGNGNTINISGLNAFTRFNSIRLQIGQTRVDAAPTIFNNGNPITGIELSTPQTPDVLGIDNTETQLDTRAWIAGTASGNGNAALFIGRPVNASRTFFKGPYQFAAVENVNNGDTFKFFSDTFANFFSDNGDPVVGQVRPVRFRVIYDDGRLTEPYSILAPVVAGVFK